MTSLLDLPAEQLAPFDAPTDVDVDAIREAIEQHKQRLNQASPFRPYSSRGADAKADIVATLPVATA